MLNVDACPTESAFALADTLRGPLETPVHHHNKHQLLYSVRGTMRFEAENSTWLLPPQRAAWITAGMGHRVRASETIELRTIYFSPTLNAAFPTVPCCVFSITSLAREMILHACAHWAPDKPASQLTHDFFRTLAGLCAEWSQSALDWRLPRARTPELAAAMRFALEHLSEPELSLEETARASGMSGRTLSRRFVKETGSTWRRYLLTARMLEAMTQLSNPDTPITRIALDIGFSSPAAFSHAFKAFAGKSPRAWRTSHLRR